MSDIQDDVMVRPDATCRNGVDRRPCSCLCRPSDLPSTTPVGFNRVFRLSVLALCVINQVGVDLR